LFERIEKELESTCLYKRIFLDYTYGLGKIYSYEEIRKARQSPSFDREYNLKYLGRIGNTFLTSDIDKALTGSYDPDAWVYGTVKSMGIDPAWGSAFGIVISRFVDGKVQVIYAEDFERADYNEMLQKVWELYLKYNFNGTTDRIYIDAANPSFIRSLKIQLEERQDYEDEIQEYQKSKVFTDWEQYMTVIPVPFARYHKDMIAHCKLLLSKELIAIHPRFDKLITSLRTAVDNEGILDKEATSYNDIFDAFRLALKFYHFEDSSSKYN
jgi:hypothetical protein